MMLTACRMLCVAIVAGVWSLSAVLAAEELPPVADRAVDFVADVRPIFQRACDRCHGADKQKSSFRLDRRRAALKGGELGAAIVPHKSAASPLIRYVAGLEPGLEMPPEGARLSAKEIGILRRWIDDGATWSKDDKDSADADPLDWWSLKPLRRPTVPAVASADKDWVQSPLDAFIVTKMRANGLSPSPAADRRTLLRRMSLDVHGLPPTETEFAEFDDASPGNVQKLVDRLLASPRYGERWARHWLDVVHFAESHGHDQDRPRETAWPFRDYVIRALNDDKPYGRFVAEQIAADVLFPQQTELIPALGLLAAGPWDESSLQSIREDTLDRQAARYLDRDDIVMTVMSAFASSTVHCARCHDHKFDPISQEDYYALQAVFAATEKAERVYDIDPELRTRRQELLAQKTAIERRDQKEIDRLLTPEVFASVGAWEDAQRPSLVEWQVIEPRGVGFQPANQPVNQPENQPEKRQAGSLSHELLTATSAKGTLLKPLPDGSLLATAVSPPDETYTVTAVGDFHGVTAVRLEVLPDDSLPHRGPGRAVNGNLHLTEFKLLAVSSDATKPPRSLALQSASADFNQDGWNIAKAIDGNPATAWGIHPQESQPHVALFELKPDAVLADQEQLRFVIEQQHGREHTIGRLRLSVTKHPRPVSIAPIPAALVQLLKTPRDKRSPAEQRELALHVLTERVTRDWSALPPPQKVFAGTQTVLRDVQVLHRGEITKPLKPASAGAMHCVAGLPARFELPSPQDEPARRAALARWLTDDSNPLTWRSIANRVWHYHFGRGLVDTPNDFGRMGSQPSHPELLDWLAVELRDNGGSLKHLHRIILTSATYRQSSVSQPQGSVVRALELDRDNRLLWRMNRTRLDAETLRDSVLQLSGQLDLTMGGPSVKQFVMSPGIHVTPKVDYVAFDVDSPASRRRSIYRFLFRTLPDPLMDSLDSPSGDQLAPVRAESVTALQAFSLLNNPFIVRQSEHFAARITGEWKQADEQVRQAFRLTLHRVPSESELRAFSAHASQHGLANVCRLLLNSNEFLFVD